MNWRYGYPFRSNDAVVLLPTRARQAWGAQQTRLCYCLYLVLKARLYKRTWGGGMGLRRRSLSPILDMPSTKGLVCALWCKLQKSIAKSSIASRGEMANLPHRGVWSWWRMRSHFVWKMGGKTRPTISGFVLRRHSSFPSHFLLLLLVVSFGHLLLVVTVLPFMASSLWCPLLALLVYLQTGLTGTAHLPLQCTLSSSVCRPALTATPASIPVALALISEGSDHRFPVKTCSWR